MIERRRLVVPLPVGREWSFAFIVAHVVDSMVCLENRGPEPILATASEFVGATDIHRVFREIPGMTDLIVPAGSEQEFRLPENASLVMIAAVAQGPATIRLAWREIEPDYEE